MVPEIFVETDFAQHRKSGEHICGDAFTSARIPAENRIISVLSDGLGSGVKANILASMTATMALKYAMANKDILRASEVIMDSLPICQVRQISYATFSIIDATLHGRTRIVEQGNPNFLFFRNGDEMPVERRETSTPRWRDRTLLFSEILTRPEDRLIVFSDGVSQSGLGTPAHRLGWRIEGCSAFVRERIKRNPFISARELARNIVNEALRIDEGHKAKDDISCAVFYFRQPRRLLVTSGPPFDMNKDKEMAYKIKNFNGRTAICGGTTANIVSRELDRKITMPLGRVRSDLPPVSKMEGVDMITEGILTLTRVANYLEERNVEEHDNAAGQLAELFLDSDHVEFMVGTRINDAHQDPTLPVDLEIRRNIIKRIASILNDNYLKDVTIEYI